MYSSSSKLLTYFTNLIYYCYLISTFIGSSPVVSRSLQLEPTTTSPAPTQVPEMPDFSEPIGNQTVALGRDAQLSCKISNLGNYRTAWLRVEDKGIISIHNNIITRNYRIFLNNQTEPNDVKNFNLTIRNVQPSDKGGYMCQINSVPMKSAVGYLDILTPPNFEDPEAASAAQLTVSEGANATLSCRASGHPAPLISWRREDNKPIVLDNQLETATQKAEGQSLELGQVSKLHSGAYLCIASNGVQPAASRRQLLDVQYKPIISLPQTEVSARIGQAEILLTCNVELNPVVGSYHWVKLGSEDDRAAGSSDAALPPADDLTLIQQEALTNSDKFDIVIRQVNSEKVSMTLSIRSIERRDFGLYRCIARNPLGIQSNSIRLYESSSFSLNNMFRSTPTDDSLTNSNHSNWQDQQDEQQPAETGRPNSGSKASAARTHTRSSWIQRPQGSNTPTKALLDSRAASSGSSSTLKCHSCSYLLLLLSSCWMFLPTYLLLNLHLHHHLRPIDQRRCLLPAL